MLRIGINLGDVIIENDDIYGDGVNIAARLEPLAEPGGICVSSIVNESVGNRIDVRFQDGGDISVKNIDRPIRIWKWHPGRPDVAANRSNAAHPEPKVETRSIAVLPFTNMSGDPEQEYISDGISEDVITDLSKIAGLLVISRNSSFTYKGRSVDIREVGRELGVRSVLETPCGLQNTMRNTRSKRTPTNRLRDLSRRGPQSKKDLGRAKSEADIALSLNPNFAGAYVILGHIQTLSGRPLEAIPALERATRLDPAFRPQHLHFLGMAYLLAGKYETAAALLRERILLMPETDFGRVLLASALGHLGEVEEARRVWSELKEINPKYSFSEHFGRQPFKREEDVQRIAEGLTIAGIVDRQADELPKN